MKIAVTYDNGNIFQHFGKTEFFKVYEVENNQASGSEKIYQKMVELCQDLEGVSVEFQKDVPHIGTVKTGCQGICELAFGTYRALSLSVCKSNRRTTSAEISDVQLRRLSIDRCTATYV